jgi:hypothetical protein
MDLIMMEFETRPMEDCHVSPATRQPTRQVMILTLAQYDMNPHRLPGANLGWWA